ncbi:MAG: DUF4174 domain-containing protein [Azospirillaceae bacterium]
MAEDAPLAPHRWADRVIVVVAPGEESDALAEQDRRFAADPTGLAERHLVVYRVAGEAVSRRSFGWSSAADGADPPSAADLRAAIDAPADAFRVVLIGKDGGVKLRADAPLALDRLYATIDAMPMRRREMREQDREP